MCFYIGRVTKYQRGDRMKIRVSYAELKTGPGYNNQRAEAEIEVDVFDVNDIDIAYRRAWDRVKKEVEKQLFQDSKDSLPF